jgi:hypothetical protein
VPQTTAFRLFPAAFRDPFIAFGGKGVDAAAE